ncbi:lipid II flippase MurJ [Fibrobacterales bacterium]|nr:lipid II flippase MurJ [Fibrobacterales bacterium]
MNKASIIIAVSMLGSRILGVLREMLLAKIAGVNEQKNALDLAFMIPDILNHLIGTGFLSIVFISLFTTYLLKQNETDGWRAFSNIFNVLGTVFFILAIPAFIFMRELILLLTFSSTPPSENILQMATDYGRIILPAQLFFFAGSFLIAAQQSRKQFFIPSLTGIIYNMSIVGFGFLFWKFGNGVLGFAWGVPIGAFAGFFVLQIYGAYKGGVKYFFEFRPTKPELIKTVKLLTPMILGAGSMFSLEFVIRSFGSEFGKTGISTLNYAYRLMYTLVAVFGFSVGAAKYPDMVRSFKENKLDELNKKLYEDLSKIFAILVPAICAVCAVSLPAVRILFEHGAFSSQNSQIVNALLLCYLPASIGLCAQSYIVRAFYACEKMWLPTLINTITFAVSLFLYKPFAVSFGIYSVPIVSFTCSIVQVAVLLAFWGNTKKLLSRDFFLALLALIILAPLGLFFANKCNEWLLNANLAYLLLYSGVVSLIFFVAGVQIQNIFNSHSSISIIYLLKKRMRKRSVN